MIFRSSTPSRLDDFVERFWHCSDIPEHRRARILPSGTLELVINLFEDEIRVYDSLQSDRCARYSGAVVSGPYTECLMIDPMQHSSIIGVHFKPGGAFPFLRARVDELSDRHVDLDTLWGRTAAELRERLRAASTVSQRFTFLEDTLVSRLRHSPQRHGAVLIALATFDRTDGGARIHDVAYSTAASVRVH